jgi:hypothetical protein
MSADGAAPGARAREACRLGELVAAAFCDRAGRGGAVVLPGADRVTYADLDEATR